jgi:hypothetical protein
MFSDSYEQGQHDGWHDGYNNGYMVAKLHNIPKKEYPTHLKYTNRHVYLSYSAYDRKRYNEGYFTSFKLGIRAGMDQAANLAI